MADPIHVCTGCGRMCLHSIKSGMHVCPNKDCLTEHWPPIEDVPRA